MTKSIAALMLFADAAQCNVLGVSDFHHFRINPSKLFADQKNPINGIENFWN